MGLALLDRAAAALARLEARSDDTTPLASPAPWLWEALGARPTASGVRVNEQTALRQATVFACVRTIAEDVASLPCITYRRGRDGYRERAYQHPVYDALRYDPNPEMDAFKFWELVAALAALTGNFYAEIEWRGMRPVLWPLPGHRVQPDRYQGRRIWRISLDSGETRVLFDDEGEMFHVPGVGTDTGGLGLSVVWAASQGIGLALAAEEFGARFFANNAQPGGAITIPKTLSETAYQRLKTSWEAQHRGLTAAHRVALLEEGANWVQIGMPARDAQLLEVRKYQTVDLARMFRMPPHKIGEVERSTSWGSGIEQQEIAYVVHALRSWLRRIEHQIRRRLMPQSSRAGDLYAEFLVEEHFRGDSAARAAFYKEMFALGALTINDILVRENMNPIGAIGDVRFVAQNIQTLDHATTPAAPPPVVAEPDPAAARALLAALEPIAGQVATLAPAFEAVRDSLTGHTEELRALSARAAETTEAVRAEGEETRRTLVTVVSEAAEPQRAQLTAIAASVEAHRAEQDTTMSTALVKLDTLGEVPAHMAAMGGRVEGIGATVAATAETLRTEVVPQLTRPAPEPPPDPERPAKVLAAHRAIWAETMGRVLRKEAAAARRAAKHPETFRRWAVTWYDTHEGAILEAIRGVVALHVVLARPDADPAVVAAELARAHCTASKRELLALEELGGDLAARVESCVTQWERSRAGAIADDILTEEVRHAIAAA